MAAITPAIAGMVALSVVAQIVALSMLPASKGLTELVPTLGMALGFAVGIGIMARIAHAGVNLGLLVPIMSALVPLGAIAVSVFLYNEAVSPAKIGMLLAACGLIGAANLV
jgi:multidrug transporter EmrE-like cation transporter